MRGQGGGRPAKAAGQKVTRYASIKTTVRLPRKGRTEPAPAPTCDLSPAGATLWARYWKLPEATQWQPADVGAVTRLVWLQQDPENWSRDRLLAEMRQLEDRFGLNPHARAMLGWELEEEPAPAAKATRASKATKSTPASDRKAAALRLINGKAS